jgi:hypothetical protein
MMRASDYRCVFFDRPAEELHHPSGRGTDGQYLDPAFVAPLVCRQHVVEHAAWKVAGVRDGAELSPNFLRLKRSGLLLVRLGEHHGNGLVTLPAWFVLEFGLMLHRIAADLGKAG